QLRILSTVAQTQSIKGFYHWSLTDNFEWSEGWRMKFGLYAFDPLTRIRTPRRSASLYRAIIHANAVDDDTVRDYAPEVLRDK
ncbi:MAG TPA: family 1 glycosylhydrolase, partial [Anaerolineae bacterium]